MASVRYERTDFYYDLHVPGPEHYLADGIWSHNTTKTTAALLLARQLCEWVPGVRGMIVRKNFVEHAKHIVPDLEQVILGANHPAITSRDVTAKGRTGYDFPDNNSHLALIGLNNADQNLGGNWDFAIVDQAERCAKKDLAHIAGCLRRGAIRLRDGSEWNPLILVANPSHKNHHLIRDARAGRMAHLRSVLRDNPRAYDSRGNILPWGRDYVARLRRRYVGPDLKRMLDGEWTSAEGQILEAWDDETHIVPAPNRRTIKRWIVGIDWGLGQTGIGCAQVWGLDGAGYAYCFAEVYRRGHLLRWWAEKLVELQREFGFTEGIADSADLGAIEVCNDRLMKASGMKSGRFIYPVNKRVNGKMDLVGLDVLRQSIMDGRTLYCADALRDRDQSLVDDEVPTCWPEEIPGWVWDEVEEDETARDRPMDGRPDHGCDTARYVHVALFGRDPDSRDAPARDLHPPEARLEPVFDGSRGWKMNYERTTTDQWEDGNES